MKTYVGRRSGGVCEVWVEKDNGVRYDLPFYAHIQNHSPTGFEWGYGGSGPAQLALALLCDHFTQDHVYWGGANTEKAQFLHQKFKFEVVTRFPKEGWRLTTADIDAAINKLREKDLAVRIGLSDTEF